MTEFEDTDTNETEEERKKKKGGKTESESIGQREVTVSQGFYAYMASIGAPASLIADVLKNWRHLRGDGLRRALSDFARKVSSRASAHIQVEIAKDKEYGLIHHIIQFFKTDAQQPDQKQRFDNRNRFDPK